METLHKYGIEMFFISEASIDGASNGIKAIKSLKIDFTIGAAYQAARMTKYATHRAGPKAEREAHTGAVDLLGAHRRFVKFVHQSTLFSQKLYDHIKAVHPDKPALAVISPGPSKMHSRNCGIYCRPDC